MARRTGQDDEMSNRPSEGTPHEEWRRVQDGVEAFGQEPSQLALAALLGQLAPRWSNVVTVRRSMLELLFTTPDAVYPFDRSVRVSWADGVFTAELRAKKSMLVLSGDHAREERACAMVEGYLAQLVEDVPPDTTADTTGPDEPA